MAKDDTGTQDPAPEAKVEVETKTKADGTEALTAEQVNEEPVAGSVPEPVEAPVAAEPEPEPEPQPDPKPEPDSKAGSASEPAAKVEPAAEPEVAAPAPVVTPVAETKAEDERSDEPGEPKEPEIELPKQLLFGRWDLSDVVVSDPGLARYINLHSFRLPHTGARHANRPFAKAKVTVVERLINDMMRTESYTGKKNKAYAVVREAFALMGKKGDKNPVQLLVTAIENSAPKEGTTSLRYGGIRIFKAVDMSPSRRLDFALRNLCEGAIQGSHRSKQSIASSLAKELRKAADNNTDSYAVSKKEEVERRAESAR